MFEFLSLPLLDVLEQERLDILDEKILINISWNVLKALSYLHSCDVFCCGLRTNIVCLSIDGEVKLMGKVSFV